MKTKVKLRGKFTWVDLCFYTANVWQDLKWQWGGV